MHKVIFILLAVISSDVMAEWVFVVRNKEKTLTVYADPTTIRKMGNKAKMWTLYDYKEIKMPGIISVRQKKEYNCKKNMGRRLFLSANSGHMAGGDTVIIYNQRGNWRPTPPGSVIASALKFACGFHPKLTPRNFPSRTVAENLIIAIR
jgi:hypothetical protein